MSDTETLDASKRKLDLIFEGEETGHSTDWYITHIREYITSTPPSHSATNKVCLDTRDSLYPAYGDWLSTPYMVLQTLTDLKDLYVDCLEFVRKAVGKSDSEKKEIEEYTMHIEERIKIVGILLRPETDTDYDSKIQQVEKIFEGIC